ncbi:MAG: 4-hydroxy-tetrahydrodipicolinate reductase [bacterium]
MIHVALCGALGRMGSEVARTISEQEDMTLAAAIEAQSHPDLGTKLGETEVVSDLESQIDRADVLVDFTDPEGAVEHVSIAAGSSTPAVVGVTGLSNNQMELIEKASARIPIVYAPNMSVGVNLLFRLVSEAAEILKEGFDFEIVEMHHRMKKDAPSGTAAKIADILSRVKVDSRKVYGRRGMTGEREPNEIGIHALRGGDVVGEHRVIFAGDGERLEIGHKVSSRRTFAVGVIKAVRFVTNRSPGLYGMNDVLGLA